MGSLADNLVHKTSPLKDFESWRHMKITLLCYTFAQTSMPRPLLYHPMRQSIVVAIVAISYLTFAYRFIFFNLDYHDRFLNNMMQLDYRSRKQGFLFFSGCPC